MDPLFRSICKGGVLVGVLLVTGWVLAGAPGAIGVAVYLFAVLLPGVILYAILLHRLGGERSHLVETVFYANLLGLGLAIGTGWALAKYGLFSPLATFLLEAAAVGLISVWGSSSLRALWIELREGKLSTRPESMAYVGVVTGIAVAMLTPVLLLQSHGYLVSDDTAVFAHSANVLLSTGDWTRAVQIFPGLPAVAANTAFGNPAISVLYALFAGAAGINAIFVAGPLYLLLLVVPTLGMYLLVSRYTKHSLLAYSLPLLWMLGFWNDKSLFFNNSLVASYYGIIPDAVLSLTGYVGVLVLFTDLTRGSGRQWREVVLLGVALLLGILSDPLTFVLLAVALPLFGIWVLHARGWRWSLPRFAVALAPTLLLLPPYLIPTYAVGASNGLSGGMHLGWATLVEFYWSTLTNFYTSLDLIGIIVSVFAVFKVLWSKVPFRGRKPYSYHVEGLLPLGLLTAAGFYFTFNPLLPALLGVTFGRFFEYIGISMVPLVAFGLDRMLRPRVPRPRLGKVATALVGVLIITCGVVNVQQNLQSTGQLTGSKSLFDPQMMAAAEWLRTNATPGTTVIVDTMSGNQAPLAMQDFVDLTFMYRPQYDLLSSIYNPPIPGTGNPYFYLNQAIEYPSNANLTAAWRAFAMKYYVYQVGYSDTEIQTFSHLPNVRLVYSNPSIEIFEYVGGAAPGFIPAVAYSSISPNLYTAYFSGAYSVGYGLPHVPNVVESLNTGPSVNGSTISYEVHNMTAGNYSFVVHRYTFQTSEYIKVSVNGVYVGNVYQATLGPNFSSSVDFFLPSGNSTITLTLEGTVGYMDPIDYVVVS